MTDTLFEVAIWTAADKTKAGLNLDDYADYDVVGAVNYVRGLHTAYVATALTSTR
jgi:hypothetical protein